MSEKRFRKGDWTNCRYDICEIVNDDDEIICVVALNDADKIIGLLEENEQLKQKIQRWKTLYEIKDKEVTARVKRLNEICNQYKHTITFDKDIDPNDAVNILCDRILQTEVEM